MEHLIFLPLSKSCQLTKVGVPLRIYPFIVPTILQYFANYVNSRYGCDVLSRSCEHEDFCWCFNFGS